MKFAITSGLAATIAVSTIASAEPAKSLFDSPAMLCTALETEGLGTAANGGWKSSGDGWACFSPYEELGTPGPNGLPSNISFYVEGPYAARARKVTFLLNVNNPSSSRRLRDKLNGALTTLYAAVGRAPSRELTQHIASGSAFNAMSGGEEIAFEKHIYRIVEFKLTLTDRR